MKKVMGRRIVQNRCACLCVCVCVCVSKRYNTINKTITSSCIQKQLNKKVKIKQTKTLKFIYLKKKKKKTIAT